ncbi:MAG TPA: glycosyltransferase family 39 protein [Candidatus Polarisedimenticolia bacterium]|nr:glycosyltransferase family 39 protein [Candidatus Polarisedimenticolia bacterium]
MTSFALQGRRQSAWEILILFLAVAAFVAAAAPALRETGTPPGWDQSNHLRDSLVYENLLRRPWELGDGVLTAILHGSEQFPLLTPSGYYPPLVPGITALLYGVAGRTYETAMATQILFLVLLVIGTRALGNRLFGAPAGLVAAILVLAAPGIRMNAEEYMLDLPLAAMVVMSTWALLASEGFSRRDWSLAFGLLAGAGMLTKWSFFLFLGLPVVWALARGLANSEGPVTRGGRWGNLALALLAAGLVAAPYYLPILPILINKTIVHAGGAADGSASVFTSASALYHVEALPRKLLGWPLTIAALVGIAGFLWRARDRREARLLLPIWALSLYAIFTFAVANKQSRYLLPWVPVLLLMAAGGLLALWRSAAAARGLLAMGVLLLLPVAGLAGTRETQASGEWNIRPLVARLEQELAGRGDRHRVPMLGVIPDMREVNGPTIAYYVARRDLPVTVVQLVNRMKRHVAVDVGLDPFGRADFYQSFDQYDFLATKDGDNAVPPWQDVVPQMQAYFEERRSEFDLLAKFREPDGSTLALYGRKRG